MGEAYKNLALALKITPKDFQNIWAVFTVYEHLERVLNFNVFMTRLSLTFRKISKVRCILMVLLNKVSKTHFLIIYLWFIVWFKAAIHLSWYHFVRIIEQVGEQWIVLPKQDILIGLRSRDTEVCNMAKVVDFNILRIRFSLQSLPS